MMSSCLFLFSLASIAQLNKTVVIGGGTDFPPYQYINNEGKPQGMFVELLDTLFTRNGYKTIYRLGDWNNILREFENKFIDVIVLRKTVLNDTLVDFSFPMIHDRMVFMVHGKSRFFAPKDLENKRIAIAGHLLSKQVINQLKFSKDSLIEDGLENRIKLFLHEKCDAILGLESVLNYQIKNNDRLKECRTFIATRFLLSYTVGVRPRDTILLNKINAELIRMTDDGIIKAISDRWMYEPPILTPSKRKNIFFLIVLGCIIGSFPLFYYHRYRRNKYYKMRRENEQMIHEVLDLIPYFIYLKEAKKTGSFIYANAKAKKYFGEKYENAKDWDIPFKSNTILTKEDLEVLSKKQGLVYTDTVFVRNKRYDTSVRKDYILYKDKPHILTSRTFITRLLGAERLAKQSEHLKTSFLINTNQEMIYPLQEINKLSEELLLTTTIKKSLKINKAKEIEYYSKELLRYIEKAANLSRMQNEDIELHRQWIPFTELVNAIELNCKNQIKHSLKLIQLDVDKTYESGEIFIDQQRFLYVIDLLFRNAFVNMKKGIIRIGFIKHKRKFYAYFKMSSNLLNATDKERLYDSHKISALSEGNLRTDIELARSISQAVETNLEIVTDEEGCLIIYAHLNRQLRNLVMNKNADWKEINKIKEACDLN